MGDLCFASQYVVFGNFLKWKLANIFWFWIMEINGKKILLVCSWCCFSWSQVCSFFLTRAGGRVLAEKSSALYFWMPGSLATNPRQLFPSQKFCLINSWLDACYFGGGHRGSQTSRIFFWAIFPSLLNDRYDIAVNPCKYF